MDKPGFVKWIKKWRGDLPLRFCRFIRISCANGQFVKQFTVV
ncbi:hypothetical protein SC1083_1658 [Aggregatibacter actinomycetemcomitans serotype e str. SC1083]|uniref:Uncharacterized protein n=1 Tax=Aggregatibacter actinomycetemcomitans serotype e str. SC1083 TaxID=907488 RepID=G4A9Y5_AGGAC|nr:hypothetical protein SC1083_1658 [Aggregatibacter actinomycetemcomitans serotype e str. SC1083]